MMIGVFSHPDCRGHLAPVGFPERPDRLSSITGRCRDWLRPLDSWPRRAPEEVEQAILAIQDRPYVDRLRAAVERRDGLIDSADNPLSEGTWNAALAAVETLLAAIDWTRQGAGRRAFAAVRPPGHHASAGRAMGFCYLCNVAVGAQYLLDRHGLKRVAVVDFDVHHGNGTQDIFYHRGDVLFASVHQHPFYPGTGLADETGRGDGLGATLNVPLGAGSDDRAYAEVFERRLLPALAEFGPQAILVSAGFDAWRLDPLGGMAVSEEGFRDWGRRLARAADELCDGQLVSVLEGGYDVARLGDLVAAYLAGQGATDGRAGEISGGAR